MWGELVFWGGAACGAIAGLTLGIIVGLRLYLRTGRW